MPPRLRVRRRPVVDEVSERQLQQMAEEATERLRSLEGRDAEFTRQFGKWTRPDSAPKYPIERWAKEVRWHPFGEGILDAAPFIRRFPDPADHAVVGEVARFVAEEYQGDFATDKTLRSFRVNLIRRLDAVGY